VSSPQRFFVAPEAIENGQVRFSREQARQMMAVLRMAPGQTVTVLDNSGWQYQVALERLSPADAVGAVRTRTLVSSEPRTKITLYVGMIRAPRLEIVLQKCTELGVAAFVPVLCQRSLVGQADELNPARLERWERIIVEAAEQSGRGKLPPLMPAAPLAQACEQARGLSLILWEGERETRLRDALQAVGDAGARRRGAAARPFSVNLFVGPEGGFADAEVERARSFAIQPVTFGPRVLRAETASVAAVSAILYAQGDLG
jgi:16S rRNA (uracil1498-N3)-methyltransferase